MFPRGAGFTDEEWAFVDNLQQQAATSSEAEAERLEALAQSLSAGVELDEDIRRAIRDFERNFGRGTGTLANILAVAEDNRETASGLRRQDGDYAINALYQHDYLASGGRAVAPAYTRHGERSGIYLNRDRAEFSDAEMLRWMLLHEGRHAAAKMRDQGYYRDSKDETGKPIKVFDGAYKLIEGEETYRRLRRNEPQRTVLNPDHQIDLMDGRLPPVEWPPGLPSRRRPAK